MGKLQIVRGDNSLESIVFSEEGPKLLVGFPEKGKEELKDEREMVARAASQRGIEVYVSSEPWPENCYAESNGIILPQKEFGGIRYPHAFFDKPLESWTSEEFKNLDSAEFSEWNSRFNPEGFIGHGGSFIVGKKVILISSFIKDALEKKRKEIPNLEAFFKGKEEVYLSPYGGGVVHPDGNYTENFRHLDVSIGIFGKGSTMIIDRGHYLQQENTIKDISKKHSIEVIVSGEGGISSSYQNNIRIFELKGEEIAIASPSAAKYLSNVLPKKNIIQVERDFENLPSQGGAIQCLTKVSQTTKLWDALGVEYKKYIPRN